MKSFTAFVFSICFGMPVIAQENGTIYTPEIQNTGSPVTNEMIFQDPSLFKKNKKPLYYVNNKEVYTISYYNKEEFKIITVLQPTQAIARFGTKGKNGAVLAVLKDEVKTPQLIVTTNRLYYQCEINGRLTDTTELYYEQVERNKCVTIDLRDTGNDTAKLYLNFNNRIKVKNLGAGWDRSHISVTNATISRGNIWGEYAVKPTKEGIVKIVITRADINDENITTEFFYKTAPLPGIKNDSR